MHNANRRPAARLASWLILFVTGALPAQHAQTSAGQLVFDVVSIHPTPNSDQVMNALLTYHGGRVVCKGCWLEYLVMEAFHLQPNQVQGGPAWSRSARFDIEARPAATSDLTTASPADPKMPPSVEEQRMLQAMLRERFALRTHTTTRQGPVYELVRNGKPLQLTAPQTTRVMPWAGGLQGTGQGLEGHNITMPQLAFRMTSWMKRPVLDKTGIEGSFDFRARMDDSDPAPGEDPWSTLRPALHTLGLDLQSARGPITTLVIDSAQRPEPN